MEQEPNVRNSFGIILLVILKSSYSLAIYIGPTNLYSHLPSPAEKKPIANICFVASHRDCRSVFFLPPSCNRESTFLLLRMSEIALFRLKLASNNNNNNNKGGWRRESKEKKRLQANALLTHSTWMQIN